jgi:hypothetical protein
MFMFMSVQCNVRHSHNQTTNNELFKNEENFINSGNTLANQNCMKEEIKRRLNSGDVSYHWDQNFWSSREISNKRRIKIHRNVILPGSLHGCEIDLSH